MKLDDSDVMALPRKLAERLHNGDDVLDLIP